MCHPEFRLYLVSRSSRPSFSTEVSSVTTLVNLRLDEEALAEEIQVEAFHRVQPHLYVESRKCLMVMMELLRLLGNIDSKLIGLVTARQGTNIWEETEVIAELVNCRTEVRIDSFFWQYDDDSYKWNTGLGEQGLRRFGSRTRRHK